MMLHHQSPALVRLLDSFTHEILKACRRHYAQIGKISALAETIERGAASPCERDAPFALLVESVTGYELNAQADVKAFRRVHNRVMRSPLDRHDQSDAFS